MVWSPTLALAFILVSSVEGISAEHITAIIGGVTAQAVCTPPPCDLPDSPRSSDLPAAQTSLSHCRLQIVPPAPSDRLITSHGGVLLQKTHQHHCKQDQKAQLPHVERGAHVIDRDLMTGLVLVEPGCAKGIQSD